jgi:hypothetical protein
MVERRFGPETVTDIRRMTALRLERDLLSGRIDVPPTLLPHAEQPEVVALGRR